MTFHAIIPAGGAGTRLWPLSRAGAPKFLADLTGSGRSLLQHTIDRLAPLTGGNITIVTGTRHVDAVAAQIGKLADGIIAEPSPRDSMAAIGLAAAVIHQRHGDVVVGSFAADHMIANDDAFRDAVTEAIAAAERGYVVTIGIAPDSPATGFGYIKAGQPLPDMEAARVEEFLEKPDADTAARYLASGKYVWNAGMFIAKTSVLLGALERYEPELYAGLVRLARDWDSDRRREVLEQVWPGLKKIAIDHAIAEPLARDGGMAVVAADMGWSDVGDYASLRDVIDDRADDTSGVVVNAAPGGSEQAVIGIESPGALVFTHSKPVAVLGIPDAVVVETADAILVTTRAQAQSVKTVVDALDATGLADLR